VEAGATSAWVDVGAQMAVLQWGSWSLGGTAANDSKVPHCEYRLTIIGVKLSRDSLEKIEPLETFDCGGAAGRGGIELLFDVSTRSSRRIRGKNSDFAALMANLDKQTKGLHGRPPSRTPVFGETFARYSTTASGNYTVMNDDYNSTAERFYKMYGFNESGTTSSGRSHGTTVITLGGTRRAPGQLPLCFTPSPHSELCSE
jgi:hypothetical protein